MALLRTRLDRDVSGQKLCKGQEAAETREIELVGTKGGVVRINGGRGLGQDASRNSFSPFQDD